MQGSYGNIAAFRLHRPTSVAEACSLIGELGHDGVVMAGGIDLLQSLKAGRPAKDLVYLKAVDELRHIEAGDGVVRIGACATHRDLASDPTIAKHLPGVARVWDAIGNVRVRVAGTIGGNVLAENPGYDGLPAMIALDAAAIFETDDGPQRIDTDHAWRGRPGLLSALEIPDRFGRLFSFDRTLKPVVSVAVAIATKDGMVEGVRAGIGCAYPHAVGGPLPIDAGASLEAVATKAEELAGAFAEGLSDPLDDFVASRGYRRRMIAVLLARQLRALCEA